MFSDVNKMHVAHFFSTYSENRENRKNSYSDNMSISPIKVKICWEF